MPLNQVQFWCASSVWELDLVQYFWWEILTTSLFEWLAAAGHMVFFRVFSHCYYHLYNLISSSCSPHTVPHIIINYINFQLSCISTNAVGYISTAALNLNLPLHFSTVNTITHWPKQPGKWDSFGFFYCPIFIEASSAQFFNYIVISPVTPGDIV